MFKSSLLLAVLFCSAHVQAETVRGYQQKVQDVKNQARVEAIVNYTKEALQRYNETAQGETTLIDLNTVIHEVNIHAYSINPVDVKFAGALVGGMPCDITPGFGAPKNFHFPFQGGMSRQEDMWNNEYEILNLYCGDGMEYDLIKVVEGKDVLDNINPGPNSGSFSYKIETRPASLVRF